MGFQAIEAMDLKRKDPTSVSLTGKVESGEWNWSSGRAGSEVEHRYPDGCPKGRLGREGAGKLNRIGCQEELWSFN
jgi:hypothetical protein